MTKAILVIYMPNHCGECACHVFGYGGYRYCCLSGHRLDDKDYYIKRLENCPLKPMPEKKEILNIKDNDNDIYEVFANKINVGYNNCINEILGEEE